MKQPFHNYLNSNTPAPARKRWYEQEGWQLVIALLIAAALIGLLQTPQCM